VFNLLCRELALLDERAAGAAAEPGGWAAALTFRLKLLHAAGLAPQLGACASCGEREHLVGFSGAAGGVVCGACEAGSFALGQEAYDFMTAALARGLTEAPEAPSEALAQVERAIGATLEHHAHVRLMPAIGRWG
jgi:DNA repair protein RecO (recombination protein O)